MCGGFGLKRALGIRVVYSLNVQSVSARPMVDHTPVTLGDAEHLRVLSEFIRSAPADFHRP